MGLWQKIKGALAGDAAQPSAQSPEQLFTELALTELRNNPEVVSAEPGDAADMPIKVTLRSETELTLYLRNTFRETRDASPEEKLSRIRRLCTSLEEGAREVTWDDIKSSLVPLVRAPLFGLGTDSLLWKPLCGDLRLYLGLDSDNTIRFVTREELAKWQRPEAQVLEQAIHNLSQHVLTAKPQQPDVQLYDDGPDPIFHVTRDDSYEASRLALPGYLASFRGKVKGNPIAIVPHRSLLLIAGDGTDALVERLARMAESEYQSSPRSVSPVVYTVDERDVLVPLTRPVGHPQRQLLERGHFILRASSYDSQKQALNARFEQDGTNLFVAKYTLAQRKPSGEFLSYATITKGIDTLLPEVHKIAFVDIDSKETFMVPWEKALPLAPEYFAKAPEHDPPRLRVMGFPSAELLARLKEHAE